MQGDSNRDSYYDKRSVSNYNFKYNIFLPNQNSENVLGYRKVKAYISTIWTLVTARAVEMYGRRPEVTITIS